MSRTTIALGAIIILLVILMVGWRAIFINHTSVGEKDSTYLLDLEFKEAKKILTRTDSLEEIVHSQHGVIIHRQWDSLNISTERLLNGFDVDGQGQFVVEVDNPDAGKLRLHFRQKVAIRKDSIKSETWLSQPCGHIQDVRTYTEIMPEGSKTRVNFKSVVKYERKVPKRYVNYMDQRVAEASEAMATRNKKAISDLMDRYKGKKLILPIHRK